MKRAFFVFLAFAVAACCLTAPLFAQTEEVVFQVPVNEDGVEAVTLEMTSGSKAVVYILKETPTDLYVENLNDSMEVSVPRSKVAKIRKPTAAEVKKVQKALGMQK